MVDAAGDRNVWIVGGGDLIGQFADVGLLDEITWRSRRSGAGAGACSGSWESCQALLAWKVEPYSGAVCSSATFA